MIEMICMQALKPDPDKYPRVIIYTEGTDFNGAQFFDVETKDLDTASFEYPDEQPEECAAATHWMPIMMVAPQAKKSDGSQYDAIFSLICETYSYSTDRYATGEIFAMVPGTETHSFIGALKKAGIPETWLHVDPIADYCSVSLFQ